jgi:hypothetical protein
MQKLEKMKTGQMKNFGKKKKSSLEIFENLCNNMHKNNRNYLIVGQGLVNKLEKLKNGRKEKRSLWS